MNAIVEYLVYLYGGLDGGLDSGLDSGLDDGLDGGLDDGDLTTHFNMCFCLHLK
jgi:hypothetical protein